MSRLVASWIPLLIGAALLGACGKGSSSGGGGAGGASTAGGGGGSAPLPTKLAPIAAPTGPMDPLLTRILAAIPADSNTVLGLSIERVMNNAAIRGRADDVLASGRLPFDPKAECGLDPKTAVKRVIVARRGGDQLTGALLGLPKQAVLDCLPKAKAAIERQGGTLTVDGVFAWGSGGGRGFGMAFIDDTTALFQAGGNVDLASLQALASAAPGGGLTGVPETMELMKKVNTGVGLWAVATRATLDEAAAQAGAFAAMLPKPEAAMISVEAAGPGVAIDARLRMSSPAEAEKIVKGFGPTVKAMTASYATKTDLVADGADLHATALFTDAQVQGLFKLVGGRLFSALRPASPPPMTVPTPTPTPAGP